MEILILIGVAYLLFHVGHSHANYKHLKRRYGNHKVNLYWSSFLGPWVSVRIPGTKFRIGHKL